MFSINSLIDKVTDFVRLKGEQLRLELMSKLARTVAYIIIGFLILLFAFFLIFFLGLALAAYLNQVLESNYLGYLIVAGIVLIKMIIVLILLKTGYLHMKLEAVILKVSDNE